MAKQKGNIDLSFLEQCEDGTKNYQYFDIMANRSNVPLMIMCSKEADPARWMIVGTFGSVHFLRYRDMVNYIEENGFTRWTEAHDRKFGMHLSCVQNKMPRIF